MRDIVSQHSILRQDTQDSNECDDRCESLPISKNGGVEKNIMWRHLRLQIRTIQVFNDILSERKNRRQERLEPSINAAETGKGLKMKEAANRTKNILHLLQSITPYEKSADGARNYFVNQKQVFILLQSLHIRRNANANGNLIFVIISLNILISYSGSIGLRHSSRCLREAYHRKD